MFKLACYAISFGFDDYVLSTATSRSGDFKVRETNLFTTASGFTNISSLVEQGYAEMPEVE